MNLQKKRAALERKLALIEADETLSATEKTIAGQKIREQLNKIPAEAEKDGITRHPSAPEETGADDAKNSGKAKKRKTKAKITKKKLILIILAAVVGLTLIVFGLTKLLTKEKTDPGHDPYSGLRDVSGTVSRLFYRNTITPTEDPDYFKLDRTVRYCDPDFGLTVSIDDTCLDEFDEKVVFLYHWLGYMIEGNAKAFNACFSRDYLENEETVSSFSPVALYDIVLTKCIDTPESKYMVEFKVFNNDGELINRVTSGKDLPFYATLVGSGEEIRIDSIYFPHVTDQ